MPEKKTKKSHDEETPMIVEVYGDEEVKGQRSKVKAEDLEPVPEGSVDRQVVEVVSPGKTETQEDFSQEMKTEVVDSNTHTEAKVKDTAEVIEQSSSDEKAFEEEIGSQKKAVRSVFGVGVVVFLIIFGLTGWAFYLKTVWLPTETVSDVLVANATPTPLPVATPAPTPQALARSEITLEILNGSGVPGLAGKVGDSFEKLGYTVAKVGNGSSVQQTQVFVKKELESTLGLLMEDLRSELKVSSIAGYLQDSQEVTARIVLAEE